MIYSLSTILFNAMKNNKDPKPNIINKMNSKKNPKNLSIDIELANIKSMELYNKFYIKPMFSILDKNQNIIKPDVKTDVKTNCNRIVKKNGLYSIGCFCIFLASFSRLHHFSYFPYFSF